MIDHWGLARGAVARGAVQKPVELAGLLRLVGMRRPRTVVEVGSAHGGTFWAWAQVAADDALLVSVDLPNVQYEYGAVDGEVRERLLGCRRDGQTVAVVRGDSHAPETVGQVAGLLEVEAGDPVAKVPMRVGRPVDFLFIDGDHSFEGVRQDFDTYSRFVGPGGVIALHDVVHHPLHPDCQVDRFWNDVVRGTSWRTVELVDRVKDRREWGGIGVVFWREEDVE